MNTKRCFGIVVFGAICALLLAGAVRADDIFTVTVNTTSLMGNSSAPFSVDFQLTDGTGTGDGNNTATMSSFNFGGGSQSGTAITTGGATGSLSSTVSLIDTSFFNNFQQTFTAGTALTFMVDLTTNVDAGGTPDAFTFSILDNGGNNVPTSDTVGGSLLTVNIDSATPNNSAFTGTGNYVGLDARVASVQTPEPGTLLLSSLGFAALALKRYWA
jgi:hypothetical protein